LPHDSFPVTLWPFYPCKNVIGWWQLTSAFHILSIKVVEVSALR